MIQNLAGDRSVSTSIHYPLSIPASHHDVADCTTDITLHMIMGDHRAVKVFRTLRHRNTQDFSLFDKDV